MSETELVVTTTSDPLEVAQAVAEGNEEGGRVPVEDSSLRDFRQSEDGTAVSYENPQSERQTLIAQLEADAAELVELTAETEPEAEADGGPDSINRMAAAQAARHQQEIIEQQHRLRLAQMEQAVQPRQDLQQEERTLVAQAQQAYQEKMAEIQQRDPERFQKAAENLNKLVATGAQLRGDVVEAIVLSGAAEGFFAMTENPAELRAFAQLPPDAQKVRIGQFQARAERQSARRVHSNAPPPIRPISGSSTRSSLPKDEMDFQDFKRAREAEIRARRGR